MRITRDGAKVRNDTTLTAAAPGEPVVLITAAGATFTNVDGGRVLASDGGTAIRLDGAGSTVVNKAGGIIQASGDGGVAILGSDGADSVVNAGGLSGAVSLGKGGDRFEQRSEESGSVSLGSGADVYVFASPLFAVPQVDGGSGRDRLVLSGKIGQVDGSSATGFETLEVGAQVTNVQHFSGYAHVALTAGGFNNFLDSVNPDADLGVAGGFVTVGPGSSFHGVTGSKGVDAVEVGGNASVSGSVALGGGDDVFWYTRSGDRALPAIGGGVDGGKGHDTIEIVVDGGATVDLAGFMGFESIDAGNWSSLNGDVRLIHAEGYATIAADSGGRLAIAESDAPDTQVTGFGATVTIEDSATIAGFGLLIHGVETQVQGKLDDSLTLVNRGDIRGDVYLYFGDDRYDGRHGSEGGTVFGFAGNDTILTGSGDDRIEGGFGIDTLSGGAGRDGLYGGSANDVLSGGDGDDLLDGGTGADRMTGGAGDDVYYVQNIGGHADETIERADGGDDTVYARVDWSLAKNVETLILDGHGDIDGVGNGLANAITGNEGDNGLSGHGGDDVIAGGAGDDRLRGGGGSDSLAGGGGADRFLYGAVADSAATPTGRDIIADFSHAQHDRIDLSAIDADGGRKGDQAFTFLGAQAFTGQAGELHVAYGAAAATVEADLDGDGHADFSIALTGVTSAAPLVAGDFAL